MNPAEWSAVLVYVIVDREIEKFVMLSVVRNDDDVIKNLPQRVSDAFNEWLAVNFEKGFVSPHPATFSAG
jgi:hypothetical protein